MAFWIFAYGSLMADGWQEKHECSSYTSAILNNCSRSFDKPSIKARGTRRNPAPTLRLVEQSGECQGVAFEFDDSKRDAVLSELTRREGKNFPLRPKIVRLSDGREVVALVPIYEGNDLIKYQSIAELAKMSIAATGELGGGVQYVRDVAAHLSEAGVSDSVVSEMLKEVERQLALIASTRDI